MLQELTSSSLELIRCIPGPMITSQSGKTSTSLLYMPTGKVAVTKRYCMVTGEELIKVCSASSKSSSFSSISTSSNTALQNKILVNISTTKKSNQVSYKKDELQLPPMRSDNIPWPEIPEMTLTLPSRDLSYVTWRSLEEN